MFNDSDIEVHEVEVESGSVCAAICEKTTDFGTLERLDPTFAVSSEKNVNYLPKCPYITKGRNTPFYMLKASCAALAYTSSDFKVGLINFKFLGKVVEDGQLKELLASWSLIELYQKLIENGYTYRTLEYIEPSDLTRIIGNDVHLNGPMAIFRSMVMQWKTDSSTMANRNKYRGEIDLESVICRLEKGKEIFKYSKKESSLPESLKRDLVKIIVDNFLERNLKLNRDQMRDLVCQICILFPHEKEDVYYHKQASDEPTGLLYVYYNNALRAQRKRKGLTTENPMTEEEQLSNSLTDEVERSLNFLKTDNLGSGLTTLKHWKSCYNYRRIKMSMGDVDEAIHDWPHLKASDGFLLICADFAMKHGRESADSLLLYWDLFLSNNFDRILDSINNPVVARDLKIIKSSNNSPVKNKEIILALHHLLIPTSTWVKKKRWTPTIPDSQEAFLTVVKRLTDMRDKIQDRKSHCRIKQMKFHPMIFEIETGSNFIVAMDNIEYEKDSIIDAIDTAFKMFDFFEIPYPHECKNVWMFFNSFFYKIHSNEKLCHKAKMLLENLKQN